MTFRKEWKRFELFCIPNGYIHFLTSYFQVYALTSISWIRYETLRKSIASKKMTGFKIVAQAMVISMSLSFVWATVPLLGWWSYYEQADSLVSCVINSTDNSWNVISYNVAICVCVFFIPFAIIVYTNFRSIIIVNRVFYYIE